MKPSPWCCYIYSPSRPAGHDCSRTGHAHVAIVLKGIDILWRGSQEINPFNRGLSGGQLGWLINQNSFLLSPIVVKGNDLIRNIREIIGP
jgi:hypothetical protein